MESQYFDVSQRRTRIRFCSSERGRRFSFLLLADTVLNNNRTESRFGSETEETCPDIEKTLQEIIRTHYAPDFANILQDDLEEFLSSLETIFQKQGHPKHDLKFFSISLNFPSFLVDAIRTHGER